MKREELRKLAGGGESGSLELKSSFDREALETAGAFANAKGGTILVGVSDRGKITGVQIGKETLGEWANQISQTTEPRLIPDIEAVDADGKTVAAIRIREFPVKPVSVRGRYFRRVGAGNRAMSPHEVAQMHLNSTGAGMDAFPAANATLKDIDLEKVGRYIKKAKETGRRKFEDEDPLKVLEKAELVKKGQPTLAAVLLFGRAPQDRVLQATVHCGRFRQETRIIDDRLVGGTVIEQIEQVMDFVRKNTSVRFIITGKPERDEVWDYPLDAVREAVANAVCHRDYMDNADVQLKVHDNRLTIWNPGGLQPGMTMEELRDPNHNSRPRNKLIAQIFYETAIIERYGSGIQRIIKACAEAGLPEPAFEEKFGGFLVVFNKDIYTEEYLRGLGLNGRQVKAVMYAKEKGSITLSLFKTLVVGVSGKTLHRDLKDLAGKGVLKELGEKKGRRYKLA